MVLRVLHGKAVYFHKGRYFAAKLPDTSLASRIAIDSHREMHGSVWQRIMSQPLGSRVLINQKRADARRDAAMRRRVIAARFT